MFGAGLSSGQYHHIETVMQHGIQRGVRHQHRAATTAQCTRSQACQRDGNAGTAQNVDDCDGLQFFAAIGK